MLKKRIIMTLLIINVIVSLFIIFSAISPYIPPSSLWTAALFGMAFRYFLCLGLLFIILWVFIQRKYIFISVLLFLPSLMHVSKFIQLHPEKQADNGMFKLMTFNTWNFCRNNTICYNKALQDSILEFIRSEKPDIACLQEFSLSPKSRFEDIIEFSDNIGLPYFTYSTYWKKNKTVDGLITFSRFPIFHSDTVKSQEGLCFAQISDIIVKNRVLRIINLQLTSYKLSTNDSLYIDKNKLNTVLKKSKRLLFHKIKNSNIQREVLINRIADIARASQYPVLLVGDFNDTPVSYIYNIASKGSLDAYRESGFGFGNTYCGTKAPHFRIDYVFYDKIMRSCNFKIHQVELSDHYPVTVMLGFRY